MSSLSAGMKVSTRLALGMGAVVILGMVIVIFGALTMRSLSKDVDELARNRMVKVARFTDVLDNFNLIARQVRNVVITTDPAYQQELKSKIAEARTKNTATLAELDKDISAPNSRALFNIITEKRKAFNEASDRAIELAIKGDRAAAGALLLGEIRDIQTPLFKAVDDSRDLQHDLADDLATRASDTAQRTVTLMALLALAMAAIGGAVGWLLTRNLRSTLGAEPAELSAAVDRFADGDLSQVLAVTPGDSHSVQANLARMQRSLSSVVSDVRQNSESVATASSQIAQGNHDLSQRTEEQASALEETAATMEQLGATVRNNADNAKQANQMAQNASTVAVRGGEMVGQVVSTMQGINDSSRKINDIISVIDGIAFQTNILALNAAVEAARAGEQGRGFAVVAGEVRTLAQRSAEAAKEIKNLIGSSVTQVEAGTVLVDQAGVTMGEIVSAIKRVSDIVAEISAASVEQSSGVQQVGDAIGQMDQVTQQNAALVEESAAAAESLKNQAHDLVKAVAVFKLSSHEAHAGAAPAAPAKRHTPMAAPRAAAAPRPASPSIYKAKPKSAAPASTTVASAASAAAPDSPGKGVSDDWESF
jgi:methyl-accepting chemotaxis protein